MQAALLPKYPLRKNDIKEEDIDAWRHAPTPAAFIPDEVGAIIRKKKKRSGKDNTGWCFDDLKIVARLADDSYAFVAPLINAIT